MKINTYFIPACCIIIGFLFLVAAPTVAAAAKTGKGSTNPNSAIAWSAFSSGGFVHQMNTSIDNGGSFSVNRFYLQGGSTYMADGGTSVSLSLGYGFNGYNFSGNTGFGGLNPWDDIDSLRFSTPLRWKFDEHLTGFVIPTIRYTGERGADFDDALSGGGFGGFSYRFSDSLTIGPGVGVLTQQEDSTRVIPILIISWKITNTLRLSTGRGTGATLGPGLTLGWRPCPSWSFSIGGRYESLRFRLDEDGIVPNGMGDDRSFPIFGGIVYSFTPKIRLSVLLGIEVGGELRLEDDGGHTILEENHDPAGFVGFAFSAKF